jgi:hypothetical protein
MEKAFVCYLDILGYKKEIVEKIEKNPDYLEWVKSIIAKNIIIINALSHEDNIEHNDSQKKLEIQIIIKSLKLHIFSDSILFSIKPDTNQNINNYFLILCKAVSLFGVRFLWELGCFFRGGIAYGMYYEDDFRGIENNIGQTLFIVSSAYIKAYELENKKADYGRIIIDKNDNELKEIINSINLEQKNAEPLFYQCSDEYMALDIYSIIGEKGRKNLLDKIKDIINNKKQLYKDDEKIMHKINGFISYHNAKCLKYKIESAMIDRRK